MYSFSDKTLCLFTLCVPLIAKFKIRHKSCDNQEIGDETQSLVII